MDNKHTNTIRIWIVGLTALILSALGAFYKSCDVRKLYNDACVIRDNREKVYTLDDVDLYNYIRNGNEILSNSDDGQIIISQLEFDVRDVTIYFSGERERKCEAKLYFAKGEEDFTEQDVILKNLGKKKEKLQFLLNRTIDKIRIDLGNETGQKFNIQKIVVHGGKVVFSFGKFIKNLKKETTSMFLVRWGILFLVAMFLGLHLLVDIKKMYLWIFEYRWLIGGILVLLCTIFKIHGDSMTMFDIYDVQKGAGSEYVQPLFGSPREIRSDEWVVDNPSIFSASYGDNPYSEYNSVLRGGDTLNIVSGVRVSYSTIGKNISWFAFKILGAERGFCFYWNFRTIFTLLINIELFYILTRRKKIYAVLGGCMVAGSPFYLWWSFPVFLTSIPSVLVCIYYFLIARKKKVKLLYAIGVAVGTANFIDNLYPAWQVPFAYVVIAFLVWLVHDYWRLIKRMDYKDWCIFFGALLFCLSLVICYFYDVREYVEVITHTVYPGARFDSGGFFLNKIMYYGMTLFYAFKEPANASEMSVFISLFPIPMVVAFIHFFKSKKKDWLIGGLLVVSIFFTIYCTTGIPEVLSKITLMGYSTSNRTVDVLGFVNIIFIILILGRMRNRPQCKYWMAGIIGFVISVISLIVCIHDNPAYLTPWMIVSSGIFLTVIVSSLLGNIKETIRKKMYIGFIVLFVYFAVSIRPVMLGFDAYFSKPVALEIQNVMKEDPDCKWITVNDDIVLQSFAAACGAPVINTVNVYPNMKVWKALDHEEVYEDVYNRYAHISVNLVDAPTSMELVQADWVRLNLSYDDLETLGVDYILSRKKLQNQPSNIKIDEIYDEQGMYIYRVSE